MFRMARYDEPLLNELGPVAEKKRKAMTSVPQSLQRTTSVGFPNLKESQVVRHFFRLSQMNYGIDTGTYPLGSCTMKYNPKLSEEISRWESFSDVHPYQDESGVQGCLQVLYETEDLLCSITGMDYFTLQPAAGAQGEFLGMLLTRAYHDAQGDSGRSEVILPDTAHGTNPASATMGGYTVVEIPSNAEGMVDLAVLEASLSEKTACFVLTNPNTLGIFEADILEIARLVHKAGALLYYDGANINAIMGKCRPGDMGFDIVHLNLHKTFATPHGGGGPGSGPVGVTKALERFLPVPRVQRRANAYSLSYDFPESVGKIRSFYGNFLVILKAYVYLLLMGADGLTATAEAAVLNANYMKQRLVDSGKYVLPYKSLRKHEFVVSCEQLKQERGIRALDVAKRLLDYGVHPPTVYFPLLISEALMIEPTESESKADLDRYVDALVRIADEDVAVVKGAPVCTSVGRVDELGAAKAGVFTWKR